MLRKSIETRLQFATMKNDGFDLSTKTALVTGTNSGLSGDQFCEGATLSR
jgi:hypothetical protein